MHWHTGGVQPRGLSPRPSSAGVFPEENIPSPVARPSSRLRRSSYTALPGPPRLLDPRPCSSQLPSAATPTSPRVCQLPAPLLVLLSSAPSSPLSPFLTPHIASPLSRFPPPTASPPANGQHGQLEITNRNRKGWRYASLPTDVTRPQLMLFAEVFDKFMHTLLGLYMSVVLTRLFLPVADYHAAGSSPRPSRLIGNTSPANAGSSGLWWVSLVLLALTCALS